MNLKNFSLNLLFFAFLLQGCFDSKHTQTTQQKQKDTSIYKLQTIENKTITLQATKDGFILQKEPKKLLLIDIFATWCPPCQAEAPILSNLASKYIENLRVIGVTLEDFIKPQQLQEFATTYKAAYPLVYGDETQRLIDTIVQQIHIGKHFPIPLMVLYKDGKILNYYVGATEEEFIESDIKNNIGK